MFSFFVMVFSPQIYNRSLNQPNFSFDICYKKCLFYRKITYY